MAYYQCFKTIDRDVYCSSQQFKSHPPAATWVTTCLAHFNIRADQILSKPYESPSQPTGATIWP